MLCWYVSYLNVVDVCVDFVSDCVEVRVVLYVMCVGCVVICG